MNGILLIDKPSGWTSFDVVAKVRGILKHAGISKPKVGHTGTLDPLATGLLVILVGNYTRRAQEFSKLDKTYEVTMRLGQTSSTGDAEGILQDVKNGNNFMHLPGFVTTLETVMEEFLGEIWQTPPAYSAVKVDGQRAYKLARAGKEVKLEPRKVTVHNLELTDYNYPEVKFTTKVSSGTYIRSLVEDIGRKLGTGAYMSALRRTNISDFFIGESSDIGELSLEMIEAKLLTI